MTDPRQPVTCRPIGLVRSPFTERFGTPRQATVTAGLADEAPAEARLELFPDVVPPEALRDLEGFAWIWVISWLHLNQGWRPLVVPTRGPRVKRGVFATRSPHRPNLIGLSACRVLAVEGCTVRVLGVDLLDGTPILDLKPYVPYADAFPDARAGWLDALDQPDNSPDRPTRPPPRKRRAGTDGPGGDQG
jgi:tRNA-Thr(GGU) m(6)t(6)A37 methyltransferase TsaA